MATQPRGSWIVEEPKISRDKVLERMARKRVTGAAIAKSMGITEGAVSRGLQSDTWLRGKIKELADILGANPMDFVEPIGAVSGNSVVERLCRLSENGAYSLPDGCTIQMLQVAGRWGMYLVGPPGMPVKSGDYVMITTTDAGGVTQVSGRLHEDASSKSHWVLLTEGERFKVRTIEKDGVASIRLVVTALGGNSWGSEP